MKTARMLPVVAAVLLAVSPFAFSADEPRTVSAEPALQEITVTAQRRAENLAKVPISISAYDQTTLDRQGVRDIADIVRITPSVSFQSQGPRNQLTIRGVSSSAGASTSGIYLDDVPLQIRRPAFNLVGSGAPKVFDVERVEVLRGPQGTYFGAGALAGAIRFITPQPSLTQQSGYARAGFSSTDNGGIGYEAGVALGQPLIEDVLGFRVSLWHEREGGYIDHYSSLPGGVQEGASNWAETTAMKAALLWQPTERMRISPSVFFQRIYANDLGSLDLDRSSPADPFAQPYQTSIDGDALVNGGLFATPDKDTLFIPTLKAEFDLSDSITLTSITAYLRRDHFTPLDYTANMGAVLGTPYPSETFVDSPPVIVGWSNQWDHSQKNVTQELRLQNTDPAAKLKWTLGAWYSVSKGRVETHALWPSLPYQTQQVYGQGTVEFWGVDMLPDGVAFHGLNPVEDRQLAGFGQVDYEVLNGLTLTAGVRVAKQRSIFSQLQEGPVAGGVNRTAGEQEENVTTPKFGVSYEFADSTMIYASAAKGNRMGGANAGLIVVPGSECLNQLAALGVDRNPDAYDSDFVWSYEIGSKSRLLDNRLAVDVSVFTMDWEDRQQAVGVPACSSGFTTNVGKASSKGFDLVLNAQVTNRLKVGTAVGYTKALIEETVGLPGGRKFVFDGDQVDPYHSPWTVAANIEYAFSLFGDKPSYVRIDNEYRSKNKGPFTSKNPGAASYAPTQQYNPSTNLIGARVGTVIGDWDVSLFGSNLANSHPFLYVVRPGPGAPLGRAYTLRSRTIGLNAVYRW